MVRFVEDTKATVETLLFKTNVTMGSTVMCGAFPLLNVSLETKISEIRVQRIDRFYYTFL